MIKLSVVVSALLISTSLTPELKGLEGAQDVAQIQYQIKTSLRTIISHEGKIGTTHEILVEAQAEYENDPSDANYRALVKAVKRDADTVEAYNELVSAYQALIISLPDAEKTYYEDTPATKVEIEEGPKGIDTPPSGESVAIEKSEAPAEVLDNLEREIKESGGITSSFAEQLRAQKEKLQSLKDRIIIEEQTGAVTTNPEAKKEDESLVDILSRAIDARRKALGED